MATSPELTSGKAENKYKYIQDLLEERRVLVLGYSGMGDVDIAFHLNKVKGKLYWVDRNPKGSYTGSPPNRFYVRSHLGLRLHQEDNLGNRNLLLKLASNYGWADEREGLLHPWKNGLQSWIDSIEPSQLASFIMSLHSWQTNWPSLHVAYYRYQKEDSRRARFELAEAELAVSAYFSAKRNLTTLISQSTISEVEDLNARAFLGFALWRMGRFSEALEVLKPLVLSEPQETGLIDSIQTPHFVIRHYLEVVDEMMSYEVDLTDRKQLFEAWNIEQAMYKLRSLRNLSPTDEYLRSAALLRIEYFIGNPLSNDLITHVTR